MPVPNYYAFLEYHCRSNVIKDNCNKLRFRSKYQPKMSNLQSIEYVLSSVNQSKMNLKENSIYCLCF